MKNICKLLLLYWGRQFLFFIYWIDVFGWYMECVRGFFRTPFNLDDGAFCEQKLISLKASSIMLDGVLIVPLRVTNKSQQKHIENLLTIYKLSAIINSDTPYIMFEYPRTDLSYCNVTGKVVPCQWSSKMGRISTIISRTYTW